MGMPTGYEPHAATANKDQASAATSGTNATTGITLAGAPEGLVSVFLDGLRMELGDGVKTKDFYFSSDTGTTAKALANVRKGDTLYWTKYRETYNLSTANKISLNYTTLSGV